MLKIGVSNNPPKMPFMASTKLGDRFDDHTEWYPSINERVILIANNPPIRCQVTALYEQGFVEVFDLNDYKQHTPEIIVHYSMLRPVEQ